MTENDDNSDWLSPKEAANRYGVNVRQVYRWIERGNVATNGKRRETVVNPNDVARMKELTENDRIANDVVAGDEVTRGQAVELAKANVASLIMQRDELQRQLSEAQEARRVDARLIGELTGELNAIKSQLARSDELLEQRGSMADSQAGRFVLIIGSLLVLVFLLVVLVVILSLVK